MRKSDFYDENGETIVCRTCARKCRIQEGDRGFCGVRENQGGKLYVLNHGQAISTAVDPVEKKPLFHYAPGSKVFSIATKGCNFGCDFCQNYRTALEYDTVKARKETPPEKVADESRTSGCEGIAYTYTEPTVFLEYALDTMKEAEDRFHVFVSNGYMSKEAVEELAPKLDAINIDLKGGEEFYREHSQVPDIAPVFRNLKLFRDTDVHVEVTNLLVPGQNDSSEEIRKRSQWIVENLEEDTPLHFSRFRPTYKMDGRRTPVEKIEEAVELARDAGLNFVYSGNVPGHSYEDTRCPGCGEKVVERTGFKVRGFGIDREGICRYCGRDLPFRNLDASPDSLF